MSERDVIIGNLTTILMFVFSTIGGGAIINWLGGTSQAGIVIGACLGLGYSILNAYFPNYLKILNNNKKDIENVANIVGHDQEVKESQDVQKVEDCICDEDGCVCEEDEGGC